MDFLEQVQEEERYNKHIKLFKVIILLALISLASLLIFFGVRHYFNKSNTDLESELSSFFVDSSSISSNKIVQKDYENRLNEILGKQVYSNSKVLPIIKLQEISNDIANNNIKKNRDKLVNFVENNQKSHFTIIAQIMWMNKILDAKDFNEDEKITFVSFCSNFINESDFLFFRAKIIESLFYLKKENNIEYAQNILNNILVSKNCISPIKKEAKSLLSVINN